MNGLLQCWMQCLISKGIFAKANSKTTIPQESFFIFMIIMQVNFQTVTDAQNTTNHPIFFQYQAILIVKFCKLSATDKSSDLLIAL